MSRHSLSVPVAAAVGGGFALLLAFSAGSHGRSEAAIGSQDFDAKASICRGLGERLGRSGNLLVLARELVPTPRAGVQVADAAGGSVEVEDNLDLYEKLGLMEGHLMIGKALLDADLQGDALPHFGHPVRELYDYLKPVFAARDYPEFERELGDLERRAKEAPRAAATTAAYDDVLGRINGLRRTIPQSLLGSPRFVLRGIALMLDNAADDLAESLSRGRIANTVEYHDAMGFARYADGAARQAGELLGPKLAAVRKETALALGAFPSLKPPGTPVRGVNDLHAAADRVKALAD